MDRECVLLLPRVCEVLADSHSSLPDDTSLEKLLDWFSGLTEAGASVLETCQCLLEFISTVISNTASDPGVLSFTLKLSGLIAATEDGFKMLQECTALDLIFNLQHWQGAGLWEDPCIRIGWILGLRSMLQHPKALSFFVQSDFIKPLLQLQTDTSLFVASAANQLLAHILLFFQPVSSAAGNMIARKDEDADKTYTPIKAPKASVHCVLNMETQPEYTAVLMAISEHLKESLVPKGPTQLHQSRQTLKLLALLLGQAGPPLQDKLLEAVTDPLEELVAAAYSELTLPVMDVIMAAHSSCCTADQVPHQSVSRLLSSMLNINKPADLILAAAAVLHRDYQDTVNTARAVRILLLPLDIITDLTLLGSVPAADEHRISMMEQLKIKTSCISVICVCLRNAPQITLMPPDVLPCSPALIVLAVLSLLRTCSGDTSSSAGCSGVSRNVIASGKVQKCALEALTSLSSSAGVKDKFKDVFTLLIRYLDNPDSDPTVLDKSYKALVRWMSVCRDLSSITDQLRQDLTRVVNKRVCDVRWEVRDSTVEFLGQLAAVRLLLKSADPASEAPLSDRCTAPLLREALQDPESYVRASAISALAQTLAPGWQQGAAVPQEQTDIVTRLLEILSEDTEGFARRAVVQFFTAWFSSRSSHTPPPSSTSSSLLMDSVRAVLSHGSVDLDWEVKVRTLELAELLIDETFSGHPGYRKCSDLRHPYAEVSEQAHTLHTQQCQSDLAVGLNNLVEQGVFAALLSGLVDCDRPVGLKACRLLITLRETVCPLLPGSHDASAAMATRVSCALPGCGWGMEIRKILTMKKCSHAKEADIASQRHFSGADEVDSEEAGEEGVCVGVCEVLSSLGLDERLAVLIQSSDHVHNSFLSLLQDILSASAAHTRPESQQAQEVIVDCY